MQRDRGFEPLARPSTLRRDAASETKSTSSECSDDTTSAVSVVADASGCTDRDATGRSATLWRAWSSVSDQSLVDGTEASSASASLAETSSAPRIAALSRSSSAAPRRSPGLIKSC